MQEFFKTFFLARSLGIIHAVPSKSHTREAEGINRYTIYPMTKNARFEHAKSATHTDFQIARVLREIARVLRQIARVLRPTRGPPNIPKSKNACKSQKTFEISKRNPPPLASLLKSGAAQACSSTEPCPGLGFLYALLRRAVLCLMCCTPPAALGSSSP